MQVTIGLAVLLNAVYVVLLALLLGVHNSTMTAGISLILVAYTVSALIRVCASHILPVYVT
jgi:hypothetical protein